MAVPLARHPDHPLIGRAPTPAELRAFRAEAERVGRTPVVGALVGDERGRVFVQKRSPTRRSFPGCWDIVGGHVEPGETIAEALAREVFEETGWRLVRLGKVVEVVDWEVGGDAKREIDLLIEVEGDLASPRLEPDKHSEGRWIGPHEAGVLLEHRDRSDTFVHDVVLRGFALR